MKVSRNRNVALPDNDEVPRDRMIALSDDEVPHDTKIPLLMRCKPDVRAYTQNLRYEVLTGIGSNKNSVGYLCVFLTAETHSQSATCFVAATKST